MRLKIILGFQALLAITFALFLIFTNYQDYVDIQISLGNSLLSKKAVTLRFHQKDLPKLSDMNSILFESKDITIYVVIVESNSTQLYGYYETFNLHSPFVEINSNIQNEKSPQAVVSQAMWGLKSESDNHYLSLMEKKYLVEGIISLDSSELLDRLAFIRLEKSDVMPTSKIIIDGSRESEIAEVVEQLKSRYDIEIIKNKVNVMEKTLYSDEYMEHFRMLVIGLLVLLVALMTIYFVKSNSEEMRIQWIVGVGRKDILMNSMKTLCLQTIIALAITLTGYSIVYFISLNWVNFANNVGRLSLFVSAVLPVIAFVQAVYFNFLSKSCLRNR